MILKFDGDSVQKFKMDGQVTADNIKNFYSDFIAGLIKPSLKSEPIPESQTEDLYKLVGKTFSEKVNDKNKDVLVLFYSDSCEHCKALMPKYMELAQQLKSNKNILIAKIDGTKNEVEG